jgi:hypothetical protein
LEARQLDLPQLLERQKIHRAGGMERTGLMVLAHVVSTVLPAGCAGPSTATGPDRRVGDQAAATI